MLSEILTQLKYFKGGVEAMHQKLASDVPLSRMPIPKQVVIPLAMSIGAPNQPTVNVGDHVYVGTVIGDSDRPISAPTHASISGTVTAIGEISLANGNKCMGITIESDGKREDMPDLKPPVVNSQEDFLDAVRSCGLIGLGGAGFPTHAKLRSALQSDPKPDTLIINAAECEPYIAVDFRESIEHPENILGGIKALAKWMNFENVIIGVEDNKPKTFESLMKIAAVDSEGDDRIKIMKLKSRYPQGAEKMMIYATTGREVPVGKLPSDVGCVVLNIETCSVLDRYLKTGRPLVSRSLTVDGDAINGPFNVRAPIGTNIQEIIDYCGGFTAPPVKIILGGPMMGNALVNTDAPLCKQNNAILAFKSSAFADKEERDCIHCGRCVEACPMGLLPQKIKCFVRKHDWEKLTELNNMNCMECGSCAFHCPAGLPLVQYMRLGKQIIREEGPRK